MSAAKSHGFRKTTLVAYNHSNDYTEMAMDPVYKRSVQASATYSSPHHDFLRFILLT